jgi:hypothetical protein
MGRLKISASRLGVPENQKVSRKALKFCVYVIGILLFLIAVMVAFVYAEKFIRAQLLPVGEANATAWSASLSSYWGAVFGGLISGLIALGGTFIMIKYYRQADIQNKINENKPFINISVQSWCSSNERNPILFELGSGKQISFIELAIKNIGKGFAQILAYYNGENIGGVAFRHTLEQATQLEKTYFVKLKYDLMSNKNMTFGIMFMDCFSNEYIQTFEISFESNGSASISCNYPQLTIAALK